MNEENTTRAAKLFAVRAELKRKLEYWDEDVRVRNVTVTCDLEGGKLCNDYHQVNYPSIMLRAMMYPASAEAAEACRLGDMVRGRLKEDLHVTEAKLRELGAEL